MPFSEACEPCHQLIQQLLTKEMGGNPYPLPLERFSKGLFGTLRRMEQDK